MTNPILVEVLRGGRVESRHRGSVAVVESSGKTVLALGDVDALVYPRSAVKALQALPFIESGAAERFGLTQAEIAISCASHNGEPLHADTSASMIKKAGLSPAALECGAHWPLSQSAARELAKSGVPTALHNNCSGKHAGFLCLACAIEENPQGYVARSHIVQREVRAAMEQVTGANLTDDFCGTDGCSIPTFGLPLRALAHGFAKFGTGQGLDEKRAQAAKTLRKAVAAYPFMIGGTNNFDTDVMDVLKAKAFVKFGAEGVYCASFPEQGLGIALKCDDGAARAAEMMMAAVIRKFIPLSDSETAALASRFAPSMINWNGIEVGQMRAAGELVN